MEPILLIRNYFKKEFTDINLLNVIYSLKGSIHSESELYNELYLLQGDYSKFSIDQNKWKILSREEADLIYNKIHYRIIQLIDAINLEDLNKKPNAFDQQTLATTFPKVTISTGKKSLPKRGVILYKIPDVMPTKSAQKCIIRIAFYEDALGENPTAANTDIIKEQIRIADTMKVSLSSIDQDSFSFNHLSDRQYLEQQDYTEWIIYATPQTTGPQKLLLQTSIYEKIKEEVVRKDFMVAEKEITIAAKGSSKGNNDIGTQQQTEVEDDVSYKKTKFSWNLFSQKSAPPLIAAMLSAGFELSGKPFLFQPTFVPPLIPSPDYDFSLDANPDADITQTASTFEKLKEAFTEKIKSFPSFATNVVAGYLIAELILALTGFRPPNLSLTYDYQQYPDSLSIKIKGDRPPFKLNIKNNRQQTLFGADFSKKEVTKNIAYKDLAIENKDTLLFHLEDEGNTYVSFLEKHIGQFDYLSQFDTLQKDTLFHPFVEISYDSTESKTLLEILLEGTNAPFNLLIKNRTTNQLLDSIEYKNKGVKEIDLSPFKNKKKTIPLTFYVINSINQKDSVDFNYLSSFNPGTPIIPTLFCSFKQGSRILTLELAGGLSADQIFIKHKSSNKAITTFEQKTIDINEVHLYLHHKDFKVGETYTVEVVDNTAKQSHFCKEIYIAPKLKTCDFPPIICNFIKSKNKLQVKVQGNCPPFRVYINGKKEGTLPKAGDYYKTYTKNSCNLINRQKLNIRVEDKNGNEQIYTQIIGDSCYVKPNPLPFKGFDCIDMDNLGNNCTIVYLYRKNTRAHWKMKNQTFNDCDLFCEIQTTGFSFYEMDVALINPSCSRAYFTDLEEVTTFIYSKDNSKIIRKDGYISPQELTRLLTNCPLITPPTPIIPPEGVNLDSLSIPTQALAFFPKEDVTYKYEENQKEGFKVTVETKKQHRIQLLSELKPLDRKDIKNPTFHDQLNAIALLKSKLDLKDDEYKKHNIYVHQDRHFWYVYIGEFETKERAGTFHKKLIKEIEKELVFKKGTLEISNVLVLPFKR